jgi:hypothetical protein
LRLYREGKLYSSCKPWHIIIKHHVYHHIILRHVYARVVPAFEEVEVGEQVSGEELSSLGSRPEVRVFEPELTVSSEQGKPRCI